ncbi:MAG: hypothetical protein ABIJ56_04615, partial [Pseudomonadota bacterium]
MKNPEIASAPAAAVMVLCALAGCSLRTWGSLLDADAAQTDTVDDGRDLAVEAGDGRDVPDGEEIEIPAGCGDGEAEGEEECDDGNHEPGDGCEPDCTWTCRENGDCDDGNACNGGETCDAGDTHMCIEGTDAPEGTDCDDGMFCTPTDACDGEGNCAGSGIRPCVDGSPCTTDFCLERTSDYECYFEPKEDMTECAGGICCDGECREGAECCVDADCGAGECSGTAVDCEGLDMETCATQEGCSWSPPHVCAGESSIDCSGLDRAGCNASECGCYWNDDRCRGTVACVAMADEASCTACGCTMGTETCYGTTLPACSGYSNRDDCERCLCDWDSDEGECNDEDRTCMDFPASETCDTCGCAWGMPSSGAICTGSAGSCDDFSSETECERCGCRWDSGGGGHCENEPDACRAFGSADTCDLCGCSPEYPCTGTHAPCSGYADGETCEAQEGCDWSGACRDYH